MKIKIVNFGPIKEFEFDLSKKLIVTYGDNNIGKSYAMQVVYLLLKAFQDFTTEEMTSMLCLIFAKKTFRKRRFIVLLKTVIYTTILNLAFFVPFFHYMLFGNFVITSNSPKSIFK